MKLVFEVFDHFEIHICQKDHKSNFKVILVLQFQLVLKLGFLYN